MNGMLLVDKPKSWTSFDVVNYIRRIIAVDEGKKPKQIKVGHCGTLDPLATGLLLIVIGTYTKRAMELTKLDKTYEVEITLGETSTTDDAEGELSESGEIIPNSTEVTKVLNSFMGQQTQVPPQFSAIKVNGKRAYKTARAGKTTKFEPRHVEIYTISGIDYKYPLLAFTAKVSSGTYIRSLARDIGEKLNTGAYLSDLRRASVGEYQVDDSVLLQGIDIGKIQAHLIGLD